MGALTSNGLNQIASLDGAGFSHDARGNLTSAGGVSYTYDAFNRLTAAGPLALVYDPAGRLYETSASGTTTRFLYAGLQAIGEYNTSGTLLRRYVPGAGLDEHLVWYEGSGTTDRRWIVQDDLGSVIATTNAAGAASAVYAYDEYGAPNAWTGARFGYTGQMMLPEAQLYHYRARAYSPALGRFLQTDPIGMAGGLNLYGYVGNDPLNWIDPYGLQQEPNEDGGGGGGVTTGPPLTVVARPDPRSIIGNISGVLGGYYSQVWDYIDRASRALRRQRTARIRDLPLEDGELVVEAPRSSSAPPPDPYWLRDRLYGRGTLAFGGGLSFFVGGSECDGSMARTDDCVINMQGVAGLGAAVELGATNTSENLYNNAVAGGPVICLLICADDFSWTDMPDGSYDRSVMLGVGVMYVWPRE